MQSTVEDQKVIISFERMACQDHIIASTRRNGFHKKEYNSLPFTHFFYHRKSDSNQTNIWLWPKQHQTWNSFFNFTYFFEIMGINIRFQKIPESTRTVNIDSEFSCKSRFSKVHFEILSYLWKPTLTFCFGNRSTPIQNKDINNIFLTLKTPS